MTSPTTAQLTSATRVDPLADERWAEGVVCFDCGGDGKHIVSIEDNTIEGTCTRCLSTGRIPWAREKCEHCNGLEGWWAGYKQEPDAIFDPCPTCEGTGTTLLHLVLASGECIDCHGKGWFWHKPVPDHACPTCHATGHALIDPFDCSEGSLFFGMETRQEALVTLYANIAKLRDTCIVHMVLAPESVERMREWNACEEGKDWAADIFHTWWAACELTPESTSHSWGGWPLDNIVYVTPGADGLEVVQ